MSRSCLCLVLLLGGANLRAAVPPVSGWIVPPLEGELAGEFAVPQLDPAPKVQWKVSVRTETPRERTLEFLVEGSGARLRGDARLDPAGEGAWRIMQAEVNVGEWFRAVPIFAATMKGTSGSGTLSLSGEGTWRGGKLGGRATASLRDGRIDHDALKIMLEGISVDIEIVDIAALRTAPAQIFTWRSGRYDVVPLGVGRIEFEMEGEEVRVTSALIDVFGGELQVGSLVMSTTRPEFSVDARMVGVAVDQLLFLLPPVLTAARGQLDGHVALKRDASGLQIGAGTLTLRPGDTAELRLAPTPGLLSGSMPPTVMQHYPGLSKIEAGEIPLRADALEVTFTPEGDQAGRTAFVHIAGGPTDPNLQAPIDLTVNVRGPLQTLIKFGTNSRLRFGDQEK